MIVYERDGFRFTASPMGARPDAFVFNVTRIVDGHHLKPQWFLNSEPSEADMIEGAAEWLLVAAGREPPKPAYCASCAVELVADHTDTDYQYDNVLWIEFHGGYGMFIDPAFDGRFPGPIRTSNPHVAICHECAHSLCAQHPWIDSLLKPHGSHSHRSDYHAAHPDHWGWDYDRRATDEP